MTEVIKPERVAPDIDACSLTEALNNVSRSAQRFLADINSRPQTLRIRAGQVQVEMEWPTPNGNGQTRVIPADVVDAEELTAHEQASPPCPASADGLFDLCAPTVGTFYMAPEPGAAPFVAEGDLVRAGQQVGIVEAMKLMIPIEAERDGQVVAVLAANGSAVEYGERLFTFATTSGQ